MVFFQQSDEDILTENLHMVEAENAQLREQIDDMERELDFKERRITEADAELKLLRSEREQFVEMGVRLEIQTKELGLIMRDQKGINNKHPAQKGVKTRRGSGDNNSTGAS